MQEPRTTRALTAQEIAHARELLDNGRALPAYWYWAPHVWNAERTKLFREQWLFFSHESAVAEPGSYATETVAGMPILVTRDKDGELYAFFNICRHRMHQVAAGCGTAKGFTCNYHGWRYRLTGELSGVPRSAEIYEGDAEGFEKEKFGLRKVRVDTWLGMIFVNADSDAPDLREVMSELLSFAEQNPLPPPNLAMRHRDEQLVDINWKSLMDNVIECYHCPTVHPELAEAYDVGVKAIKLTTFACGAAMQLPPRGDHTEEERHRLQAHTYYMPPTGFFSCKGDMWALMVAVDPINEHRSRLTTLVLAPEDMAKSELDAIWESADLVNRQDIAASASVQIGYDVDPDFDAYQLPHSEHALRKFARMVLDSVSD